MAAPFTDLEQQLWAWLEGSPEYSLLRLRPYRGWKGEFMPVDEGSQVPVIDLLPGIEIRAKDLGLRGPEPARQLEPVDGQAVEFVEVQLTLVYASEEAGYPRSETIEPAIAVILDRLNERDARAFGMNALGEDPGPMSGYRITNSAFREIQGADGEGFTWLWAFELTLELYGQCRQIN